ncbi:MAG: hypothetical protein K0Q72_4791 [Armatimonadetes bacterium]|jgi:hypothetical protein|nr:hypothetical protein [Armatimonadota bacterium]
MDNATIFMLALIPIMVAALILLWRFFLQADRREMEQLEQAALAEQERQAEQ